jgi:iron complex outermembrane receptor protein
MDRRPCLLLVLLFATPAFSQEPVGLERVVITGSHLPRLDAETALPVQVIRRDEIERSGVQTVEELLDRVTANFGGQREAMGLGGTTPGFSGASLRGLGAGQTLVLLNSRRLANYAFTDTASQGVDVHAIPLAAIDRVEILKDGASAIYGSDAIAGVINFITRSDYAGADVSATYSAPEAGGGERTRITLAAGLGEKGDRFNVFGVVDAQKTEALRAIDRPALSSGYHPELGLGPWPPIYSVQPMSWPANVKIPSIDNHIDFVNPAAPACTSLTVNIGGACLFDAQKLIDLVPSSEQLNLFGRGTLRLAPDTDAYAEVSGSVTRIQYRAAPSPADAVLDQNGMAYVLPASSPYYPASLGLTGDLDLSYRTLPLGGRVSEVESTNVRVLVGTKWHAGDWDLDAALAVNDSRSTERYVSGYVDGGRLSAALATGLVNPFGPSGPEGDALLFGSEVRGTSRKAEGRTQTADLRASRDLLQLANGPLAFVAGVEARHEYLRDSQGAVVANIIGAIPAAPKEGARDAQAAFVEFVAPLAKGLEVQAAARLDHYSDFGTSVSPKIAARFQPAPSWLLRGSLGRGFRAPSLPELYTLQTTMRVPANFSDPVWCPVTGDDFSHCPASVLATSGGNPALQPQRSTQASLGFAFDGPRAWFASVDFWAIRVKDTIGSIGFDQVVSDIPAYEGKNVLRGSPVPGFPGLPGPITGIVTLNENLGDQQVSGADLTLSLRPMPTAMGRFSARLDGTYVFQAWQELVSGYRVDGMGRLAPRWNHILTLNLDQGPWTGTLSQRYRRGYTDENPLPDGTMRRVDSYVAWDGQVAYAVGRDTKVWIGVRNLLDKTPPFTNTVANFQLNYDPLYADPQGRTWIFGLRVAWL